MEKLNIAEILKDCPSGMELDCTMCDNLYFDRVENDLIYCYYELDGCRNIIMFYENGCYTAHKLSKCVIFPKGKTTWEGFQRPFKDGDIITCTNGVCTYVAIYKCMCGKGSFYRYARLILNYRTRFSSERMLFSPDGVCSDFDNPRFATEEEKEKLFKAIKDNGYKWNAETKTLEKLIEPQFKVGDRIKSKDSYTNYCNGNHIFTITEIRDGRYWNNRFAIEYISKQDNWELVHDKFDITTLKPFESRVLVRTDDRKWVAAFYSHYDKEVHLHHCVVGGLWYEQCIPYNDETKHLLDTTEECYDYYKTWE